MSGAVISYNWKKCPMCKRDFKGVKAEHCMECAVKLRTRRKNMTIAIGDIHGQYDKMMNLLSNLVKKHNVNYSKDTLVFLGDYVDGGPDTNKVIDFLINSKRKYPHWHFLYGNHEDLLIDALNPKHPVYGDYYIWWNQGGRQTTESYIKDSKFSDYEKALVNPIHVIPAEHFEFINSLETYYENDKYFFVHGGVHAYHTVEWAKENMSRYDMIWERGFIESNMEYEKKIIFGHTIRETGNPDTNLHPWVFPNKIGIDTMAHGLGDITAVILPEETFETSA